MDILNLIKTRRSTRKYKSDPVPKELIEKVVTAGIWAPSSLNRQPWRFIVITNEEKRKRLSELAKKSLLDFLGTVEAMQKYGAEAVSRFKARAKSEEDTIFYEAPALIAIIQKEDVGSDFDFGLAAQNMMLAAHGLGLGTCPIGLSIPLNESVEARKILALSENEKLVITLCLGYPNESPEGKGRDENVVNWLE